MVIEYEIELELERYFAMTAYMARLVLHLHLTVDLTALVLVK